MHNIKRQNFLNVLITLISALCVGHFIVALLVFWGMLLYAYITRTDSSPREWNKFINILPAIIFLILFGFTYKAARKNRTRIAVVLFCMSLSLSLFFFIMDTRENNYQMQIPISRFEDYYMGGMSVGLKLVYFNWWWYYEVYTFKDNVERGNFSILFGTVFAL